MRCTALMFSLLAILMACTEQMNQPERPRKVPNTALWAGGADGGAWFLCKDVIDKPLHYDCTIYNDFTGDIGSQGRFILRGYTWNEEKKRATYHVVEPLKELSFRFYDGEKIYLNESRILLPDGVIDYPFGDGNGKKRRYELGELVGTETEY